MVELQRIEHGGAAIVGCAQGRLRFGFTERAGGVSAPPYASLNMGAHVGDDPAAVAENRRRALALLGAAELQPKLLVPNQVHGSRVVTVSDGSARGLAAAAADIAAGADAIVCTVPGVPVLLNFADCAPLILACEEGARGPAFAVAHSGWKGTLARIAAAAARGLARAAGAKTSQVCAYIGPHITGADYEVSEELLGRFFAEFGPAAQGAGPRLLDLSACIRSALVDAGVPAANICDTGLSTVSQNDRFFSYRAEGGVCGRHGAIAVIL